MQRVGEHPVPAGPLAVRWLAWELDPPRAGVRARARLELENAGSAAWRTREENEGVHLAYHWLDELGNPIVWDGIRTEFDGDVEPGQRLSLEALVRAPIPPGAYRLAFDLVEEGRWWFEEIGNTPLALPVQVAPRIARRALAVRGADPGALDALEEPPVPESEAEAVAQLAPGVVPDPDWSRRVLDAHERGYAAVAGSVAVEGGPLERRRLGRELAAWRPGVGVVPGFDRPLLCASVLAGTRVRPADEVAGLPAVWPPDPFSVEDREPWLYDGRIALRLRPRRDRRPA
jgi:hypothetical protein